MTVDVCYEEDPAWSGGLLAGIGLAYAGKPGIDFLIASLEHSDPKIREDTAHVPQWTADPKVKGPPLKALEDPIPRVRAIAVIALRRHPDREVAQALGGLLDDGLRGTAVWALASIGRPAVPELVRALGNEDVRVREEAAYALSNIPDPSTVPALVDALGDPAPLVRGLAAEGSPAYATRPRSPSS
jgi:HEAT repeat protein